MSLKVTSLMSSSVRGGAEVYLSQLSAMGRENGLNLVLVGNPPVEMTDEMNVRTLHIGPKWSKSTVLTSVASFRTEAATYHQAISSMQTDVFHCQYKREQIGLSRQLSRTAPVVWTEHGEFIGGATGRALGFAYKRAARHVSNIICVSNKVADSLASGIGIPENKLVVIENSVGSRFYGLNSGLAEAGQGTARPGGIEAIDLLVMCRLERNKGVDRAINLMDRLPDNFRLTVAGEGSYRENLEKLASRFGPRVRFLGYVADPAALLRRASIFLLLSRPEAREGIPMSLLEAAAAGVPLVVAEDSGLKTWSDTHHLLVSKTEPAQLSASIFSVVGDQARYSQISRLLSQKLNPQRWIEQHKYVFENAVRV